MQPILDAPMASSECQQVFGIGAVAAYARDGIADFVTPLALEDSCSLDAYGLGEAWPIKMAFQTVADLDFANLGATVAIVDRPAFIKLLQSLAFAAGGSVQT